MDISAIGDNAGGIASYAIKVIENLRHLPGGQYLVTDSAEIGKGQPHGFVTISRKSLFSSLYTVKFSPLQNSGGPAWEGELESKYRMMCEGVYRYALNHACGSQRLFLLGNGVIKVFIRSDEKPDYLAIFYWLKLKHDS